MSIFRALLKRLLPLKQLVYALNFAGDSYEVVVNDKHEAVEIGVTDKFLGTENICQLIFRNMAKYACSCIHIAYL